MTADIVVAIQRALPNLSAVERRIAQQVLADPDVVVRSTITELATACGTSTASVARFCRSAGFAGYKQFRMAVAGTVSHGRAHLDRFQVSEAEISPTDDARTVVTKVAVQEMQAIEATARHLDTGALDAVVAAIRTARRIEVFGVGSSGLTAQDLQHKLTRLALPVSCFADAHLALTSAAHLTSDGVAIVISHSGLTAETLDVLRLAQRSGATTVAITNAPGSELGRLAGHVLATASIESRFRAGAMSSRLAQMALVDFLVVRLLQGEEDAADALRRTYEATHEHRSEN